MTDELIALLKTLGFPVMRQGSLAPDQAYPPTFLTFWGSEDDSSFYDNDSASAVYSFSVYVYSNEPSTAYATLDAARWLLKRNGWTITSRAFDVQSDEITHIGRGMLVAYLKPEEITQQEV